MARLSFVSLTNLIRALRLASRRRRKGRAAADAAHSSPSDPTAAIPPPGTVITSSAPVLTTDTPAPPQEQPTTSTPSDPQRPDQTQYHAPIAMPGMNSTTLLPTSLNPNSHHNPQLAYYSIFTPRSSATPDRILTTLPVELQLEIIDHLDILNIVAMRDTCRTWKRCIPEHTLSKALTRQNHQGWPVISTFQDQRYPGTTYGNRKLCGGCVRPKPMSRIISGEFVAEYLSRRGVKGVVWEVARGMCFPCLWVCLVGDEGAVVFVGPGGATAVVTSAKKEQQQQGELPIWQRAAIAPHEQFRMMDGSRRKPCTDCAKDIHSNAVPCPYCVDFGHWLKHRDCCGKRRPCEDGTQQVDLARQVASATLALS